MKKASLIFLTLFFISVNAISQNDTINQIDETGLKTGHWIYYYDNGLVESEGYYQVLPDNREELFMRGIYSEDSITYASKQIGEWLYYDINGKLLKGYSRLLNGNLNQRLNHYNLLHINAHILDTLTTKHIKHTINTHDTLVNILNLTGEKYIFQKGFDTDSIQFFYKNPNKTAKKAKINTFGYNISTEDLTDDFDNMKIFNLHSDTLYFYRMYRACEMKLYKYSKILNKEYITSGKAIPIITIPVSSNYNSIDISSLRKEKYLLRTVNYDYSINLFAIIQLK